MDSARLAHARNSDAPKWIYRWRWRLVLEGQAHIDIGDRGGRARYHRSVDCVKRGRRRRFAHAAANGRFWNAGHSGQLDTEARRGWDRGLFIMIRHSSVEGFNHESFREERPKQLERRHAHA